MVLNTGGGLHGHGGRAVYSAHPESVGGRPRRREDDQHGVGNTGGGGRVRGETARPERGGAPLRRGDSPRGSGQHASADGCQFHAQLLQLSPHPDAGDFAGPGKSPASTLCVQRLPAQRSRHRDGDSAPGRCRSQRPCVPPRVRGQRGETAATTDEEGGEEEEEEGESGFFSARPRIVITTFSGRVRSAGNVLLRPRQPHARNQLPEDVQVSFRLQCFPGARLRWRSPRGTINLFRNGRYVMIGVVCPEAAQLLHGRLSTLARTPATAATTAPATASA